MEAGDDGAAVRFGATTVGGMEGDGFQPVRVETNVGAVEMRYYPADGARAAVVYVGGVGGGWDTPGDEMYPRLCAGLKGDRIAGLRVRYRDPRALTGSVVDVLTGIRFLLEDGIFVVGVVGHSFGGAVAIRTGAAAEMVRTVVALATQAFGTDDVGRLAPRCSLLLVHGLDDRVLPADCSRYVLRRAGEPKRAVFLPGAGHALRESAGETHDAVRDWLLDQLGRACDAEEAAGAADAADAGR
jgi:pimeloyl-ACP methyl ester carboxylesterase